MLKKIAIVFFALFVFVGDLPFHLAPPPEAHAWGGSTWRRIRDEARRARDRIRRELERARRRAIREAKRAATRVREGNFRVNLDSLRNQALSYVSSITAATPFLPASQIVQMSLATLDYERVIKEMESLDMNETEIQPVRDRLNQYKNALDQLEGVRVDAQTTARLGFLPPGASAVNSAASARLAKDQIGEYMGTLFFQAAFYQGLHGEVPNQRPVTLIYKMGQALIDYAHLKADIKLISETQSEHAGLYDALITNGGLESVASTLQNALSFLETMPVSNTPDPPISANSRLGRLIDDLEDLTEQGHQLIAQHYDFPLMKTPNAILQQMESKITEASYNRGNTSSAAWILLLPQEQINTLDRIRGNLERVKERIEMLHIHTPEELVGRFFFEALFFSPRYDEAIEALDRGEPTSIGPELEELRNKLNRAMNIVQQQNVQLPGQMGGLMNQTLSSLTRMSNEINTRMNTLLNASSPPPETSAPAPSTPPASPPAPTTTTVTPPPSRNITPPSRSRRTTTSRRSRVRRSVPRRNTRTTKPTSKKATPPTPVTPSQASTPFQTTTKKLSLRERIQALRARRLKRNRTTVQSPKAPEVSPPEPKTVQPQKAPVTPQADPTPAKTPRVVAPPSRALRRTVSRRAQSTRSVSEKKAPEVKGASSSFRYSRSARRQQLYKGLQKQANEEKKDRQLRRRRDEKQKLPAAKIIPPQPIIKKKPVFSNDSVDETLIVPTPKIYVPPKPVFTPPKKVKEEDVTPPPKKLPPPPVKPQKLPVPEKKVLPPAKDKAIVPEKTPPSSDVFSPKFDFKHHRNLSDFVR